MEEKTSRYKFNNRQTPFDETVEKDGDYVDFMKEVLDGIPFIKNLTNPNRSYAKDLERKDFKYAITDDKGNPTGEFRIENKIDPDITNPHILEDMDYFRPAALHFKKHGTYTNLTPNRHPKSEYTNFWREEKRRCIEGLVRESDGEWVSGYYYWYLNYSRISIVVDTQATKGSKQTRGNRVEDFPEVWDADYLYFHYLELAESSGLFGVVFKTRRRGYEQPYSEIVMTPHGESTVGEIKINDFLLDKEGNKTKVLEIFEQGEKDVYEFTFRDGRKVKCGLNHLWQVYNTKNTLTVLTTKQLLQKNLKTDKKNHSKNSYNYHVPINEPVTFSNNNVLDIAPYTLGAMLGDGSISSKGLRFSTNDIEILNKIQNENKDIVIKKTNDDQYRYSLTSNKDGYNRLSRVFRKLKLIDVSTYDKFIPEKYKKASIDERLELVKGLMDTDGSSSPGGAVRFSNTSETLIDDLAWVLRSLGISVKKSKTNQEGNVVKFPNDYSSKQHACWVLNIVTDKKIFYLKRKNKNIKKRKYNINKIAITNIEKLNYKEQSRCFLVDNKDHLYLTKDFIVTHNSFKGGANPARNFTLIPKSNNFLLAYDRAYLEGDGIWAKAMDNLDWVSKHTPFPRLRYVNKQSDLIIKGGYKMKGSEAIYGSKSLLTGIVTSNNEDKARGIAGKYAAFEEAGKYPKLLDVWGIAESSFKQGNTTFGFMVGFGTGGSEEANFQALENLFLHPKTYSILGLPNVYDFNVNIEDKVGFFSPEYLNRGGCFDENGNSDVIKALGLIFSDRIEKKHNSNDPFAIVREKAERPITPTEGMMRKSGTMFPVYLLTEYLADIKSNESKFVSQNYVVDLELKDGNVIWKYNKNNHPIRKYPHNADLKHGAVELFQLPDKMSNGKVNNERYILGADTYDDDTSTTTSLGSVFVFDLFTDTIVAEYTGRPMFASDFYEICRRLCILYNGKLNYENNKKGLFGHFRNKNSLFYLEPMPEYLLQKNILKSSGSGNTAYGTPATAAVNMEGLRLQSEYLQQKCPVPIIKDIDGVLTPMFELNYKNIKSVGYIEEAVKWNPDNNFDRVSAMNMVMISRANRALRVEQAKSHRIKRVSDDPFFKKIFRQSGNYSFKAIDN